MGLNDNTAGWIVTTVTYTLGGRMERGRGTSATATLNNLFTVQGLNLLRQMRWNDKSMGSTFDYTWPTINQAFAAGKIGMFINGSDIYTFLVQAANLDPAIYGIALLPLAKNKTAGVLGGGSIAVVRPDTKGAKLDAALKWIDFFYMEKLIKKPAALRDARFSSRTSSQSVYRRSRSSTRRSTSSRTLGSSPTSTFRPIRWPRF